MDLRTLNETFDRLWPICRSVAGGGFRESLAILRDFVPFESLEFATGASVLDWTVPEEWYPKDAFIVDPQGKKRLDFRKCNLHLVSHSMAFRGTLPLGELKKHLYSLPKQPEAVPYVTSYYKKRWGFCISYAELQSLPEGEYQVVVDAELRPGKLIVGEAVLPGRSEEEVLFSSYLCHPSLANNELSGPLALTMLYRRLAARPHRKYTYRFVVSAETIGTVCYLSQRGEHLKRRMRAGYQLTCLGDRGQFTFKKSRRGDSLADRAALAVLQAKGKPFHLLNFDPGNGSDERQYCSPGYDLPVASLMRTMYSRYPEYHTSLDNKDLVSMECLAESVDMYESIVNELESRRIFVSKVPFGEPQLGKRGLYPELGEGRELEDELKALMWMLNYADGEMDLYTIAERSGLTLELVTKAAEKLSAKGLIQERPASV